MIHTWGSSTKKLTHSDSTLKSIQNWSSFSSLGLKSCRRKIWRQSCEATVRESHVNIGWLEKVSTDNGILYLSLFQVGTDAGEGENPDRQKRGRIKKIKRSKQFYVSSCSTHFLWFPRELFTKFKKHLQSCWWESSSDGGSDRGSGTEVRHSPPRSLCLWCHRTPGWCHRWKTSCWPWEGAVSWASGDTEPLIGWSAARSLRRQTFIR